VDTCLWMCCGVIACSKCVVDLYDVKPYGVCPWCGSLAVDIDGFMEMIIPVENSRTCILSPETLTQVKTCKGCFFFFCTDNQTFATFMYGFIVTSFSITTVFIHRKCSWFRR